MKMKLVIVESPAKSKTIKGYLGKGFEVLASFGHIRDLPSKDGSIDTSHGFEPQYQIAAKSAKAVEEIVRAAKNADEIYLATDPDREGEAISWHVLEVLKLKKVPLAGKKIKRIAFNQITKKAVEEAVAHPREVDANLVDAQQARLSLDYLVGFNISPVLWRKLPGSKSAGRVQSVALRIVCEREEEIEKFKKEEYWTVEGVFNTSSGAELRAGLEFFDGKKLEKFDIKNEERAKEVVAKLLHNKYNVSSITKKEVKRRPYAPFITSSLQQDASSKLGFSPKRTMSLAQTLYEGVSIKGENKGLITYMRTDSPTISAEGIGLIRGFIGKEYGERYLSKTPNVYTSKAKNSQEAHEAIRPVEPAVTPEIAKQYLKPDEAKLYELIWKRAVASQAAEAVFESTAVEIATPEGWISFKANGSVLVFDGYNKIYNYSESNEVLLPAVKEGEAMKLLETVKEQHFTQAPPRFTEASLIKRLEELGIGRPSTYASIISVIQEREYVKLDEKKRLIPEERGRVVTAFLEKYFPKYVEYSFTAKLEEGLDLISEGELKRVALLSDFWKDLTHTIEQIGGVGYAEIAKYMEERLEGYLFKKDENGKPIKTCPACKTGTLGLKIGKFGLFVSCSNYPNCKHIEKGAFDSTPEQTEGEPAQKIEAKILGKTADGEEISLKSGPYGPYLELPLKKGEKKPRRVSIPKGMPLESVDVALANKLLSLPRVICTHEGAQITASIGPYGPYLAYNKKYTRLKSVEEIFAITQEQALEMVSKNAPAKAEKPASENTEEPATPKKKAARATKAPAAKKTRTIKKKA